MKLPVASIIDTATDSNKLLPAPSRMKGENINSESPLSEHKQTITQNNSSCKKNASTRFLCNAIKETIEATWLSIHVRQIIIVSNTLLISAYIW